MSKKRKRHGAEEIVRKLRDADAMLAAGRDLAAVLQALEVSEATLHRWRNQYGGMKSEEAKRRKQLEEENARLKRLRGAGAGSVDAQGGGVKKLVSPAARRAAVEHLQARFDVSERRACAVLDQPRSTQR